MGAVEEHLSGNATLVTSLRYQLKDLWNSPRVTVLRIEAFALVAIILSFFLALFGSCRRWSNRWIVQKGFLAAQVLSLSLGTYSIGLMQSSQVKNEMYPIWAVSLLTLFGCVDPVTTYIGLDYKGPLSKMIFQLCLYFGYVMLMSVSTISSNVGKVAIGMLSAITFIKGFHRSLVFVLPGEIREDIAKGWIHATEPAALAGHGERLKVHLSMHLYGNLDTVRETDLATMADVQQLTFPEGTAANGMTIMDVCLSYSFSHLLRKHFLGLDTAMEMELKLEAFERLVQEGRLTTSEYKRGLKVVEVELAFLFEAFFTSNEFLYLYQTKTGSFWALASFIGICFLGVVTAVTIIPGAIASRHNSTTPTGGPGAGILGTTDADLIITLIMLVSLALLQLVQLIRCWTSNWARVEIACLYAIMVKKQDGPNGDRQRHHSSTRSSRNNQIISWWVMELRLFLVARVHWFDKYLWQARLGQDSLAQLLQRSRTRHRRGSALGQAFCCFSDNCRRWFLSVGVRFFCRVVEELFLMDTTNPGGAVRLHDFVKESMAEFLGTIKSRRIGVEWSALFVENGLQDLLEYLPYTNTSVPVRLKGDESKVSTFTRRVMIWHIATWYCEEAEKEARGDSSSIRAKNRRVAMDLSKYCTYLVVSAPELLPGSAWETKQVLEEALFAAKNAMQGDDYQSQPVQPPCNTMAILEAMQRASLSSHNDNDFVSGVYLGKRLRNEAITRRNDQEGEQSTQCSSDHWELLALLWVQTLLYAAPYGDVQTHMQRLAKGGEFITHLWALLYHLGIDKWEVAGIDELKAAAAGTTEIQVVQEEDAVSGGLEIEEIN